jgi:hypothetical protein
MRAEDDDEEYERGESKDDTAGTTNARTVSLWIEVRLEMQYYSTVKNCGLDALDELGLPSAHLARSSSRATS